MNNNNNKGMLGIRIDKSKRLEFKHIVERQGSSMESILNDFIKLYIDNKLTPDILKNNIFTQ